MLRLKPLVVSITENGWCVVSDDIKYQPLESKPESIFIHITPTSDGHEFLNISYSANVGNICLKEKIDCPTILEAIPYHIDINNNDYEVTLLEKINIILGNLK